MTGKWKEEESE
jgi:hypothetical protein